MTDPLDRLPRPAQGDLGQEPLLLRHLVHNCTGLLVAVGQGLVQVMVTTADDVLRRLQQPPAPRIAGQRDVSARLLREKKGSQSRREEIKRRTLRAPMAHAYDGGGCPTVEAKELCHGLEPGFVRLFLTRHTSCPCQEVTGQEVTIS